MIRLLIVLLAAASPLLSQQIDLTTCSTSCDGCLTITEPIIMDPTAHWGRSRSVKGASADSVLRYLGVTDSAGNVVEGTEVFAIRECSPTESMTVTTYYVNGTAGEHDKSIYAVATIDGTPRGKTCIGILKADCAETYVRGCTVQEDGTLRISELRHTFDCEADTFIATEQFEDSVLRLNVNGAFEVVK